MTKRLSENDRRAVDLLLDRSNGESAHAPGNGFIRHAQLATEPALEPVQKVLTLLDHTPAAEPPVDLVSRTLAKLNSSVGSAAMLRPSASTMMTDQPHA